MHWTIAETIPQFSHERVQAPTIVTRTVGRRYRIFAATGFPSRSFVAVNHFLDRLEKRLQFEVAIVPLAIDKKCRRTVYPAAYATGKVLLHTLGKGARPQCVPECLPIKREAMRQFPEHLLAKRILVLEDQVMHVPELAMGRGKLSGLGGDLGVWMYFSQREVSKDKPQLFSQLLLKRFGRFIRGVQHSPLASANATVIIG